MDDCQLNGKLEPGKVVLKVNAMASDYEIIEGGANFIRKYNPIIIAEYGTRHDDLYRMIPFIKSLNLDYTFYFRVKKVYEDIKVVMYAKEIKNV